MINMALSAARQKQMYQLLKSSHRVYVGLTITDLSHNAIKDVSERLVAGQVTFDSTTEVTRQLNLELFDPGYTANLDDHDPADGSGYPTVMIKCVYGIGSMNYDTVFAVPLFHGPVTKVSRNGHMLSIECSGKEVLSAGALLNGINGYKGWNKATLIKHLMTTLNGEQFFDLEGTSAKTTSALAISREQTSLWGFVKSLANSDGKQLFYDGAGRLRSRTRPNKVLFTFDDYWMMDAPQVEYDASNVFNVVDLEGATPKKAKSPIRWRVVANPAHPMSAQSLGRGGVPQYRVRRESNNDIKELSKLRQVAERMLDDSLLQAVTVSVPSRVAPMLEEDDWVAFKGEKLYVEQRLRQWTVPLIASTPSMTIGYFQNVQAKRRSPSPTITAKRPAAAAPKGKAKGKMPAKKATPKKKTAAKKKAAPKKKGK